MALASIVALSQIRYARKQLDIAAANVRTIKSDSKTRLEREAAAATAEQCKYFAEQVIPASDELDTEIAKAGVKEFTGTITDNFDFSPEAQRWLQQPNVKTGSPLYVSILRMCNMLEAFSLYFVHGVCDATMARTPVARCYIGIVQTIYPVIAYHRNALDIPFGNIVTLYNGWVAEVAREKAITTLVDNQAKLAVATAAVEAKQIMPPIGLAQNEAARAEQEVASTAEQGIRNLNRQQRRKRKKR